MDTTIAPRFRIENTGWAGDEADYRPYCGCGWGWQPGDEDDPLGSREAAARFARADHPVCWPSDVDGVW